MNRRHFVKYVSAASLGWPLANCIDPSNSRSYFLCLNPGAIGVKAGATETLELAIQNGYEGITPSLSFLQEANDEQLEAFMEKMKGGGIQWGSTNLPIEFRKDEQTFKDGIQGLSSAASTLQKAGATRMNTWIMPTHDSLPYLQNFKRHVERLGQAAKILADYGIRLGLEYVGPKTLMARDRFAFMRTMTECKELIASIGQQNVGFVLDSFHWYCAGETQEEILSITKEDIVTVDLNDATAGRTADEQIDGQRQLPGATGLIPIQSFLEGLVSLGYQGPVRAEPFNKVLNDMEDAEAVSTTMAALKKVCGDR